MLSNPGGRPVPPSVLRRRGRKRLSAVTAGVGVASVLATGAIAAGLPGPGHGSGASGGTGSGAGSRPAGHSSGGSRSASSPATPPASSSGGAHATSGAS